MSANGVREVLLDSPIFWLPCHTALFAKSADVFLRLGCEGGAKRKKGGVDSVDLGKPCEIHAGQAAALVEETHVNYTDSPENPQIHAGQTAAPEEESPSNFSDVLQC